MKHLDVLDFSMKFQGIEIPLDLTTAYISLKESIYDLYNSAHINFFDTAGILQELGFITLGAFFDIEFGIEEEIFKCKYVLNASRNDSYTNKESLSGKVDLVLSNANSYNRNVACKAHKGEVSEIIKTVISSYDLTINKIDQTGNGVNEIWYQDLVSDETFLSLLLSQASSTAFKNSPFFMWIDLKNRFNFINYTSMLTKANPIEVIRRAQYQAEDPINLISNLAHQQSLDPTNIFLELHVINKETGQVSKEKIHFKDYPIVNDNILVMNNKDTSKNGFPYVFNNVNSIDPHVQGSIARAFSSLLFFENFAFSMSLSKFSLKINSGDPIDFKIFRFNNNEGEYSPLFSGKYIVISKEIKWSPQVNNGILNFVIGRRSTFVPSNLKTKNYII